MLLTWAIVFLVIGLIALLLGSRGVANFSFSAARLLFVVFLIIAVVLFLFRVLG